MFFTLAAGLLVAATAFIVFLRSRHNRELATIALEGDGRAARAAPSGALPELLGVLVISLIAMTLLAFGYNTGDRPGASIAGKATPVPTAPTNTSKGTTVGAGATITPPEAPSKNQPANPAPDLRTAPTSSSSGSGPDSGGRPENAPK
jgi:hypothetical protein